MNKGKIALLQITPFLYTDNGTLNKENEQRIRDIDECLDELEEALDKACELLSTCATKPHTYFDEHGMFVNEEPIKTQRQWKEYLLKVKDNG